MIPLRDFFRNPEKTGYQVSHDGHYVSWLSAYSSRLNIHIQKTGSEEIRRITSQTDRDITVYFWLNNRQLAFLKDHNGDENYHLFVTSVDDAVTKDLTPFEGVKVDIVDELEDIEDEVLIQMNRRNPEFFDVYRLHTGTGALTMEEENPGNITGWITDHAGKVRMAVTTDGVNSSILYRENRDVPFRTVLTTDFRETLSPMFFDFEELPDGGSGKTVYALSNLGRDKVAVVRFDPETGRETEVLFEHPEVDVFSLGFSKKRKVITAAAYITWKTGFHFFDTVSEQRYRRVGSLLRERFPGESADAEVYITGKDKEENVFIVRTLSDKSLGNYYLYDTRSDSLRFLADVSPWLKAGDLADMKPVSYVSRDGLTIHGYLTLPKNVQAACLPLVVNPHGGPWARDTWHFNPEVQFLANRGYAVLQMNFRGSTGYGKRFWEASFKEWGRAMQDDITDGVKYLQAQGIADPRRIAIYGGSYGGYAVLAGLTFTPDLYACGIDYVGVSNLFTFMETIPPYWKPYLDMMHVMVGDPTEDGDYMRSATPLFHADKIRAPLLIAQGAMDPRVKKSESDQMVQALRERGIEVSYMVKENEGHGFHNEENRFDFYEAMENFLQTHLQ